MADPNPPGPQAAGFSAGDVLGRTFSTTFSGAVLGAPLFRASLRRDDQDRQCSAALPPQLAAQA